MKFPFIIFSISAVAFLMFSGCATSYKALGFNGGYSEIKTTPDSFIVTFKGNEFTSQEKVMQYALKRASELTTQNGYKYFSVISSTDRTKSYNYSKTSKNNLGSLDTSFSNVKLNERGSSSTYSGTVMEPKLALEIKCFKEKTNSNLIDAEYFLKNN